MARFRFPVFLLRQTRYYPTVRCVLYNLSGIAERRNLEKVEKMTRARCEVFLSLEVIGILFSFRRELFY